MQIIQQTERLVLRHATPDDAGFILALMNEPSYIANIGDRGVRTISDAAKYVVDKYLAAYQRDGFGMFLVETREEGTPIGICGLVKRDGLDQPDLGFALLQKYWSKGYAFEAAKATRDLARGKFGLPYLYGVVSPGNAASIRLLERLGMHDLRSVVLPGQSSESRVYRIRFDQA